MLISQVGDLVTLINAFDTTPEQQQALIDTTLERLSEGGAFSAVRELRTLAIEAICRNVFGLPAGEATDAFARDYAVLLPGITAVPIPVPGTPYGRARAARHLAAGHHLGC